MEDVPRLRMELKCPLNERGLDHVTNFEILGPPNNLNKNSNLLQIW